MSRVYISVIGGSEEDERVLRIAERVGEIIAEKGGVLVCGGKGGVMEASSRGAKLRGGLTIGILPEYMRGLENEFIDISLPTGLGHARNLLVVLAGHAVIVVGGGAGTLSEIGFALVYGKPVIAIRNTGGVAELLAGKRIKDRYIYSVSSPEEAVELAFKLARSY